MELVKNIRDIPGYGGVYKISKDGRVFNSKGEMKQIKNSSGYYRIILSDKGIKTRFFIHRLIMLTYVGPSDLLVNHIDGVKTNNNLDNLEYTTKSGNFWHADSLGKIKRFFGVDNKNSKKVAMLNKIGEQLNIYESIGEASRFTGIDSSCISKVCLGKRAIAGGFIWKFI